MNWIVIRKISFVFIVAFVLAILAGILTFSFVEYGHKDAGFVGCYAYDAMLIGFECQGFVGQTFIGAWLNWPLWLVFAPMFAIFSIKAAVVALLVWLPLVIYFLSILKARGGNA